MKLNLIILLLIICAGSALYFVFDKIEERSEKKKVINNLIELNKNAMISDIMGIAALAQQYYYKPKSIEGGEGSFEGFEIPFDMRTRSNGFYQIDKRNSNELTLLGFSEMKNSEDEQYLARLKVTAKRIGNVEFILVSEK